jgi:hypothetical protein
MVTPDITLPAADVRLVALDIDGTLLEPDKTIAPELSRALRDLRDRGVELTTASGRPADFQIELLDSYGLGAADKCFTALITDERELYLADGSAFVPYEKWNRQVRRRWRDLFDSAMDWLGRVESEATRRGFGTTMFALEEMRNRGLATLICESAEQASALRAWVAPQLAAEADLLCNQNVQLLQIVDAQTGKGPLLSMLAGLRGFSSSQVLAVGDSVNDVGMLDGSHGFHAATVGNAGAEIRDLVRAGNGYVASRPNGHGVTEILDRLSAATPGTE